MNPNSDIVDKSFQVKAQKDKPILEQQTVDRVKMQEQELNNQSIEQPEQDQLSKETEAEKILLLDSNQIDDDNQLFSEESDQFQIVQQLIQKVNSMKYQDKNEPLNQQVEKNLKQQQWNDVKNEQILLGQEEVVKQELTLANVEIQMITESDKLEQEQVEQHIIQQKQPNQQTKQNCPYPKPFIQISMPYGIKYFLLNPPPKGGMIQCTVKRDKTGMLRLYPEYHMYISTDFSYLMSAKKQTIKGTGKNISNCFQYLTKKAKKRFINNNYIVSLANVNMQNKENYLGKVKSNSEGTDFILYDQGENPKKCQNSNYIRQQLGVVNLESQGSKGPRKIRVILPNVDEATNQIHIFKPNKSQDGLLSDIYLKNEKNYFVFQNIPPKWNEQHQAFIMNFHNRGKIASKLNCQLALETGQDKIFLQIGKEGKDLYNVDFQWPITPLQAFQIMLTCFDGN